VIVESKEVKLYLTQDGKSPYVSWIRHLDGKTKGRIEGRVSRLLLGHLGKSRSVGKGVVELILDFGPGYRVYIGQEGHKVIILLCGGDKSTQRSDIIDAQKYWDDYQERAKKARQAEWIN
jgi:putative addiction module killer protein